MSTPQQALEAQSLHEADLLAKPNVVGVAVGFKEEKGEKNGDIALIVAMKRSRLAKVSTSANGAPAPDENPVDDVVRPELLPPPRAGRHHLR